MDTYTKKKRCFYSLTLFTDPDKVVFIDRITIFYGHHTEYTLTY